MMLASLFDIGVSVCVRACLCLRHHSGVELRRMGLCGTEESEGSDMAAVVNPIFFRERSSVTEMERENMGREAAGGPETERERERGMDGCMDGWMDGDREISLIVPFSFIQDSPLFALTTHACISFTCHTNKAN